MSNFTKENLIPIPSSEVKSGMLAFRIGNEFFWNGNEYYLSLENQFNFKNLYDLRNMKEYPVTIKTKTGFTTLNSLEEVEYFYLCGVMFIEKCLHTCWEEKIAAEEEIRKNTKTKIKEVKKFTSFLLFILLLKINSII